MPDTAKQKRTQILLDALNTGVPKKERTKHLLGALNTGVPKKLAQLKALGAIQLLNITVAENRHAAEALVKTFDFMRIAEYSEEGSSVKTICPLIKELIQDLTKDDSTDETSNK